MAEVLLSKPVQFWRQEIELYERTYDKWVKRARKIQKRYKDVRSPREETVTRFNVLWANVQTRLPALYARDPLPEVERRFKDRDPIGRQASEVLERSIDYTIQHCNDFGHVLRQSVLDWELTGRGTVWARYVPHFHKVALGQEPFEREEEDEAGESGESGEEVAAEGEELTNDADDEEAEETLHYEETLFDYVQWDDFGHSWARTWDEVRAVWRRVYLTREEGTERFGDKFKDVPLDWQPKNLTDSKIKDEQKKAVIYEVWDKQKREVLWVCKNYKDLLDKKKDPLGLKDFFPTPRPLYSNLTGEELIPTPNFIYYQDQAREIDELSARIVSIGKALKVAGVRDSSAEGLDRLLAEGTENALVPVDSWSVMKEKGGLKGVMELLPLDTIAEALGSLREQRKGLIDDVYEITGISDIIRGLSEPNETATAQQIKGQFAVLRISDAQTEVQRFCRDLIRIAAEIVADYDIETLKQISGVKLLTQAEKGAILAQLNSVLPMPAMGGGIGAGPPAGPPGMGAPAGQQPPGGVVPQSPGAPPPQPSGTPPGVPQMGGPAPGAQSPGPDKLKLLKEPTWEEVGALLQNPVLREFRIDIETDSTIRVDEDSDRNARMAFVESVTKLIGEAAGTPKPLIPAVGEVILFAIRGFKVARNLERVFEDAIEQLRDMPSPPDPEQMKAQLEQETAQKLAQIRAQTDIQIAQGKQQAETQNDLARNQAETQRAAHEAELKTRHEQILAEANRQFEAQKSQFETEAKERIAQQDNATKLQIAQMNHEHEARIKSMEQQHEAHITGLKQAHEASLAEHQANTTKEVEGLKGQQSLNLEHVRGEHQAHVAALKPEAEAKHRAVEETEKQEPHLEAIEKLTKVLEDARKPRKIVRDEHGQIVGIH